MVQSLARADRTISAAAGAFAFLFAWAATSRYGLGISPDSAVYIWAATNLEAGRGMRILDGAPYVHWGPLYPALLAIALRLGVSAELAARLLSTIGYAVFVAFSALWLRRVVPSAFLWGISVAAVALSTPVFDVFTYAWSESLLLVFVALFLLDADSAVHQGGAAFARLAVWSALAALARYAGITLAVGGALLLLADPTRPRGKRLVRASIFFAASAAPLALWLARNARVSGAPFGERSEAGYSLWEAIGNLTTAVGGVLFSTFFARSVLAVLALVAAVALFLALVVALRRGTLAARGSLLAAVAVLVPYLAMLVVSTSTVATDRASDRLVVPIVLPLIGIVFAAVAGLLRPSSAATLVPRNRMLLALALLAVWFAPHLARTARHAHRAWTDGVPGYTDRKWRSSEVARELSDRVPAGVIYSNAPDAFFYFTRREARLSPHATVYYTNPDTVAGQVTALAESVRAIAQSRRETRLVWFDGAHRQFLASPDQIGRNVSLTPEWSAEDGIVYRVR